MPETSPPQSAPQPIFDFDELAPERESLKKLESEKTISLQESAKAEILALTENTQHPLYELPPNADEHLRQLQGSAQQKMILMVEYMDALASMGVNQDKHAAFVETANSFLEGIRALESAAQEFAREDVAALAGSDEFKKSRSSLKEALGLKGEQQSFDDLLAELASPIQSPSATKVTHEKTMQARLDATYQSLIALQYELLTFTFGPALRSLQYQEQFPDLLEGENANNLTAEEVDAVLKTLAVFVHQRRMYEARLQKAEPDKSSNIYAYLGVAAEEVAEEFAEGSINFGTLKPGQAPVLRFLKLPNWFTRMDIAAQRNMLVGFQKAKEMLGANAPKISEVLGSLEKSPIGSKFWKQLMTIESPVTVALYAMYVHSSGNPLKATMDFAGFLATSAASNALLASATELLAGAALVAQRAKNTELALRLLTLARLPKHPAIQFAAAIGIALGMSPVIDACTSWVDEQIPDSAKKRGLNNAISIVSGSSIIDSAQFLWTESGFGSIDTETDATSYLSKEVLAGAWDSTGIIQSRKMNGIIDWNEKVDRAAENETNPLMRKLHQLEHADYGGPWAQRRAFELYSFTEQAKQLQSAIGAELVKRGKIKNAGSFDLLTIATSDTSEERPDWQMKIMEDDTRTATGASIAYIKSLGEKDELSQLWKSYRPLLKIISERVATYRHLQIYNKQTWLGDGKQKEMPKMVQDGIAAEISYQMQRKDILTYSKNSGYSKDHFMLLVTDVEERRAHRDVPMKLQITDETAWPNAFTDLPGWLKRLQKHNDINKNVIDKVDRHFLELVLASLKAESTQGKNAFRFAKLSEKILAESQEQPELAMHAMLMAYAKTLPDEDIAKQLHPSRWWQDEYNKLQVMHTKEKDPIKRAELSKKMLKTAADYRGSGAGGVSSLDLYKKMPNDMSVNTHVCLRYDVQEKTWYVDTTVHAEMPYIAISGLGSRHHFPKMNIRETVPFSQWRKDNPVSAAILAPEMIWHEKFITQMAKVQKEDEDAMTAHYKKLEHQRIEQEKTDAERARDAAKARPNMWVPFGQEIDNIRYERVLYHADGDAFIYLKSPEDLSVPAWRSADSPPAVMQTRLLVTQKGKSFSMIMGPNYRPFIEHFENGAYANMSYLFTAGLTFPYATESGERLNANSMRQPIMNMLGTFNCSNTMWHVDWQDAVENAVKDEQFYRDPETASWFLRQLHTELDYATRVGSDSSKRKPLTLRAFVDAIAKTKSIVNKG
jgi:hypothetical protein